MARVQVADVLSHNFISGRHILKFDIESSFYDPSECIILFGLSRFDLLLALSEEAVERSDKLIRIIVE